MVYGIAISGIQAASKNLEVTGNNIANASTIGFKRSRAEFADIYSAGSFGGGRFAIGSGVKLSRVQQLFGQGDYNITNNSLDLAVGGNGFFVLNDQGANVYTRAGAFNINKDGYIVNSSNQRLTGFTADNNGQITTLTGDLQVNKANLTPKETARISAGFNLNSSSIAPTVDWAGGASPAPDTYNNTVSSTIYDSLGNSHVLSMYFIQANSAAAAATDPNAATPPGTDRQWYVAFQIDNQNVPANAGAHNTDNLYRINFNDDGSFNNAADQTNTALPSNLIPLSMALSNGANSLNISVDLSKTTLFSSNFSTQSNSQDGYTTGRLEGLNIDEFGVLYGSYSNGQARAMGQVRLANFDNPDALQNLGDTNWAESSSSGQPLIGEPGAGSLGLIQSGALEMSNVDLTSELVNLITAQRDFQANAQIIRTADAVAQTIINVR